MDKSQIIKEIEEVGPWFHQIQITDEIKTRDIAPSAGPQPLDHPMPRWKILEQFLPTILHGQKVLDIGCADGFFSIELAKRGASVLAVDASAPHIKRLNWVIKTLDIPNIQTRVSTLEELERTERFDFIYMIALLYHLKNPLLGLEILSVITRKLFLETVLWNKVEGPYLYLRPPIPGVQGSPRWLPTHECVLEMLAFTGFKKIERLPDPSVNRGIYLAEK